MFSRGVCLWASILLLVCFVGCTKTKDVTNDPNFGNFKSVAGVWETKVPLRLVEIEKKLYLVTPLESHPGEHELYVVPKGTEIRIERLIYQDTFETTYLNVMGVVAGPYSGKSVNIDGRFFTPVKSRLGGDDAVTFYYSVWNQANDPKPDWSVDTNKLERVSPH